VTASAATQERTYELLAAADDVDSTGASDYEAKREQGAVPAFNRWLRDQLQQGVFEATTTQAVRDGQHFTARYIRAAAERGWDDAGRRLRRAGVEADALDASFNVGVPQRQLRELYTRTYRDLQGITRDLEDETRNELTQGLAEGIHPRKMARRLNRRVDVAITRAERLARTEVIRSYNEEALTRFAEAGVDEVAAEVEFLTAPSGVCPECRGLSGRTYTIDEARGVIPVHPNCRCTWIPVMGSPQAAS
jgi:SPP1 gp7 family putative phage head morphogenesis protein